MQTLDHLLLGEQRGGFLADLFDFLNLFFKFGDFFVQIFVAVILVGDLTVEENPKQGGNGQADGCGNSGQNAELFLPRFAFLFAVRE